MNLYNTGFSAGIVAAFLVPLIEALPKRKARIKGESLQENTSAEIV
jgi:hypothetical protein